MVAGSRFPRRILWLQSGKVYLHGWDCRLTIPLWVSTERDELFDDMAYTYLNRHGLVSVSQEEAVFGLLVVARDEGRTLLAIDLITESIPDSLIATQIAGYSSALRLLSVQGNRMVLVREFSRWVLAVYYNSQLIMTHDIGELSLSRKEIAGEIYRMYLSLEGDGFIGRHFVLHVDESDVESFKGMIKIPVDATPERRRVETIPPHIRPIVPLELKLLGRKIKRRKVIVASSVVLLSAYIVLVAFFLWRTSSLTTERDALALEHSIKEPKAKQIRKTADYWKSISNVINIKRYPLVQLNSCAEVLPPTGIRLRYYINREGSIRLSGVAMAAEVSFQYLADLESSKFFSDYKWKMYSQKVQKDNTTEFIIRGDLYNGSSK